MMGEMIRRGVLGLLTLNWIALMGQKVGVGLTNPQAMLHVRGNTNFSIPLFIVDTASGTTPILTVMHNGNVGINVSAPSEALDVYGNIKFKGALMPAGAPGTPGQVLVSQGANMPPSWESLQLGDTVCSAAQNNYLMKYVMNPFTGERYLCNSQIYDNSVRIGVRTSSPQGYFHIKNPPFMNLSIPALLVEGPPTFAIVNERVGVGTTSPEELVHITRGHGVSWPYYRSVLIGSLGGYYEGEYIGFNAKLDASNPLPMKFIKLGGGTNGNGEQWGGAVIVTDLYGNMHFQTHVATTPGKDTMPDTTIFKPMVTISNQGNVYAWQLIPRYIGDSIIIDSSASPQVTLTVIKRVYSPFNNHQYLLVKASPAINWIQASKYASKYFRGYLVTITSVDEQNLVWNTLMGSGSLAGGAFIGYTDARVEGQWEWITGEVGVIGNDAVYSNWDAGEPNNSGGTEDCGSIKVGAAGRWNDLHCTNTTMQFFVVEISYHTPGK